MNICGDNNCFQGWGRKIGQEIFIFIRIFPNVMQQHFTLFSLWEQLEQCAHILLSIHSPGGLIWAGCSTRLVTPKSSTPSRVMFDDLHEERKEWSVNQINLLNTSFWLYIEHHKVFRFLGYLWFLTGLCWRAGWRSPTTQCWEPPLLRSLS